MRFSVYSVFILYFLLLSCGNKRELQQVSKLVTHLDNLEEKLKVIDANDLKITADSVVAFIKYSKANYQSEGIIPKLSIAMNDLRLVRSFFKGANAKLSSLQLEIKTEKETLAKLTDDITIKAGDRTKYEEYIVFEKEKVKQIDKLYVNFKNDIKTYKELFVRQTSFAKPFIYK